MNFKPSMVSAGVALALLGAVGPVHAQGAGAKDALVLEEITVTARKTEERLIEAPVSITAFSAADIEKKGFVNLEDVAKIAPGVQYSQQGGQIPGRFTSAIRFRGMNVNSDSPSLQLGSLFIDGVYVLGGTQSIPFDDVERIEVIKGPQSATYGRSTFGGAINYITRTPSLTEYSGKLQADGGNFGMSDVSASFEGPLAQDKVSFRVGARFYNRGAVYRATDGGGLGEESSKSASLTLNMQPSESLNIKFRAFHALDEDGPAMGGIIEGYLNDTCTGTKISTQDPAVPTASPTKYVCGAVPELGKAISATGGFNIIDTPTTLFPAIYAAKGFPNLVYEKLAAAPSPVQLKVPTIDHVGLIRTVTRFSVQGDYTFGGGYNLAAQAGKNELKANWIRAFGLTPRGEWWSRDPQDSQDKSYEIRLASPREQALTWLVGYNSYQQTFLQSGSGGDSLWVCPITVNRAPGAACAGTPYFAPNSLAQNTDKVTTTGIFASVSYEFNEAWSASVEARRQTDKVRKAIFTTTPLGIDSTATVPRAILRWTPSPETNVYASYAKGVLPGVINAEVGKATDREIAQYKAQFPTIAGVVPGDELKMLELGWKQQWLDRRAQTNIAAYWGDWKNMKGRTLFVITEDCGSFAHGGVAGATAANGCPNGPNGLPATTINSRNANVSGTSKLHGLEFEGSILLTDHWDARATFTWAASKYDDFIFNFVKPIAGFTQMKGNQNARFPEFSGSLSTGYTAPLGNTDWKWFVNGDLNYVGKTYVDESNLAYCKSYTLGNVRVGGEKQGLRLEGYVKNVTDNDSWAACARWTDFDAAPSLGLLTFYQGIAVTPNMPRQYGIRASYKF